MEQDLMVSVVAPEAGQGPESGATPPAGRPLAVPGRRRIRLRSRSVPYLLLLPALVVLAVVLGYPLYRLGVLSTQRFGLPEHFGAVEPEFIGLENFRSILGDSYFWAVLRRSLLFCAATVVLIMVLGTLVALLLGQLGRRMRTAVSTALLLAWAVPPLTATVVWQWIFDSQSGVANWLLTKLGADYQGHSWLSQPASFFAVAGLIVVWMGVPFMALTLHAGMTQIPTEVLEAAAIDGAGPWQRFRDVVVPTLKPLLLILVTLSTIWNLRVFTQIYVLQKAGGITRDTNLIGVWAYRVSIGENRFDIGATVALVMVAITLLLTFGYLRAMFRQEEP